MELEIFLYKVVENPLWHKKWLNTLSFMENCGARKIASFEHPTKVRREVLKHAAEEFRHAYFLKQQISKLSEMTFSDYSPALLFAAQFTRRLLDRLENEICKLLKRSFHLSGRNLKEAAYLFVTYAIEFRAKKLYAVYQRVLKESKSVVSVQGIIFEEEQHFNEMEAGIKQWPFWQECLIRMHEKEEILFLNWLKALKNEISPIRLLV